MNQQIHTFAVHDEKGFILKILHGPHQYTACEDHVLDTTHYVDAETHEVKEKHPLAYDVTAEGLAVTVNGLPDGLAVEANGQRAVTDNEPLVITFDIPGTYSITLSGLVEYLDETLEVTVDDT